MAQDVFPSIAKAMAEARGLEGSVATFLRYEGLGIKLQRANACAFLSRVTPATAVGCNNTALATASSKAALLLSAAAAKDEA